MLSLKYSVSLDLSKDKSVLFSDSYVVIVWAK